MLETKMVNTKIISSVKTVASGKGHLERNRGREFFFKKKKTNLGIFYFELYVHVKLQKKRKKVQKLGIRNVTNCMYCLRKDRNLFSKI